ncbi:formylmethanofuran dehydrogenase subunit C [Chthonobacter albigriseus]|uniref:formylmethanofuran dehydrogenase subunit C n=1 Tax=Chthonobacter albigriseus TaxID=1683161 RepID=UPI0015EE7E22|nr:formylmethanofuran dehydrogenase subunit C [Chthonobacter albigriseus]
MAALGFTLRHAPPERLDLSPLIPAELAGKSLAEIEKIAVGTSRAGVRVGDVFAVSGEVGDEIRFEGHARLDNIGRSLNGGRIIVDGDVGAYLGRGMKKGAIEVSGSATGPYAGTMMTGGAIRIGGDAADGTAGSVPGAMHGMAGGLMVIAGAAGAYLGDRMRRGVIVVLGGTGDAAGARMVGGTIVADRLGTRAGAGMKRGTLIATAVDDLEPTFVPTGTYDGVFLAILAKHLATEAPEAEDLVPARTRRFRGDMAALGKGEVLVGG